MTTRRRSTVFQNKVNPPQLPASVAALNLPPGKTPAPRRNPKHKPQGDHKAARFIPIDHVGKVAVCFASGPGLTPRIVEQIRPYHEAGKIVACGLNDTYKIVDYLDEFYACDERWWKIHINQPYFADGKSVVDIPARLWGNQTAFKTLKSHPHINIVQGHGKKGFSPKREYIHWGSNSGFQLLNLVYHMGVEKIILVGYNMGIPAGKEVHFFGKHPERLSQGGNQYKGFAPIFAEIAPDAREKIVNCTVETMLRCFVKADLTEELAKLDDGLPSPQHALAKVLHCDSP